MFAIASRNLFRRVCFQFCNIQNSRAKLKEVLERQIKHQNENLQDVASIQKFFRDEGWTIKYNNIQVQLQKQKGPYTVSVVFNARSPMPIDQEQQNEKNLQEEQRYIMPKDLSSCAVFIKKTGMQKSLMAEFLNSEHGSQLQNMKFTKDVEQQKLKKGIDRLVLGQDSVNYKGPQFTSLDDQVRTSIYIFIDNLGVNQKLLKQVANYGMAYEQKFYIQWLKDLDSLT